MATLFISQVSVTPSFAIGVSGSEPFGLSPSPDSQGLSRAYFVLQAAPGQSVSDSVVVSDQGRNSETLLISPALGVTASNSGAAYEGAFAPCTGTACWITGLPSSVNLSPGESKTLPFTVSVPAGAAPSQYLAGITAKPAQAPGATQIGGNQKTSVNAIIVHEITIGVAISTGSPAQLSSKLVITGVSGTYTGTVPRLMVQVKNEGERYAKGNGIATCSENGLKTSLPVYVDTVLPGQSAVVPVNLAKFKSVANCVVHLDYGSVSPASWTGSVKLPVSTPAVQVPIAKGVYATLPPAKLPVWGVALLIAAGALVLLLLMILLFTSRRRRRRKREALEASAIERARPLAPQSPGEVNTQDRRGPDPAPIVTATPDSAQGGLGAGIVATEMLATPGTHDEPKVLEEKPDKGSSKKKNAKGSSKKNR
ncbi:MAG: COG1470 family protein [Acidimicrobiales bacterium]